MPAPAAESSLAKGWLTQEEDAAVFLVRIPDAALRRFAQIELAAALAGLPELPGAQREYRSR